MKKNKKLFAILTLVAFMMTLMPVMAFAAPSILGFNVLTEGNKVVLEVQTNEAATVAVAITAPADADTTSIGLATSSSSVVVAPTAKDVNVANVQVATKEQPDGTYRGWAILSGNAAALKEVTATASVGGSTQTISGTRLEAAANKVANSGSVDNNVSDRASVVATNEANVNVERVATATTTNIDPNASNTVAIDIVLRNSAGTTLTNLAGSQDVYIWVEESGLANQASDALVIKTNDLPTGVSSITPVQLASGKRNNVWKVTVTQPVTQIYAQFLRANTTGYTLKASLNDMSNVDSTQTFGAVTKLAGQTNKNTIVVEANSVSTRDWSIGIDYYLPSTTTAIDVSNGASRDIRLDGKKTAADGDRVGTVQVYANTVSTTKVELQVFSDRKNPSTNATVNVAGDPVANYPITLSTNSANIELDKTTITTDYNGKATFNVAGLREGEYKIYVTMGDYESQIIVKVGATAASQITTTKFPSNPIATDTEVKDYANIFRMVLTDANGNIVTGNAPKGAEKAGASNPNTEQAKYVSLITAPENNKVKDSDIYLKYVDEKEYYTIGFKGDGKSFTAEGSYEVRVVLDNGNSVTIPFEVKKFDKAVSLHIEYPTESIELNAETDIPDIYFLDANNVLKKANNRVTVAATGYAVAAVNYRGETGVIKVKNDEKYLGSTITVSAVAEKENLVATTTLTVTDSAQSIKLDTNRGQVNASNRVGFKLVNSNGQAVALGNDTSIDEVTCIVTNVENPDAKVSFSVAGSTKGDLQNNGTGVVVLSSNKETTATVQIMVKATKKVTSDDKQDNNTGLSTTYYTGTETFTFGAEADKSVVMTIGSKEIVANNVPATIDVAPFIRDNRTFVPFRALVEAFGAEVAYDEATSTVTTKLDGKTVVLTVGSTVLTVNDETVTMDVAPYIVNDRVVVPVRFVGEAFGFTVEATQDAETGATASVVFYQK